MNSESTTTSEQAPLEEKERELLLPRQAKIVGHKDNDDTLDINREHVEASDASLALKEDHANRPLWVTSDGIIIMEASGAKAEAAQDFLTAIAEPVTRPAHIHEYRLTPYSLYAAVSVGMETEDIISVLDDLCKTALPDQLLLFIRNCTTSYGKIKLVLRDNKYLVESAHSEIIRLLLNDPVISAARPPPDLRQANSDKNDELDDDSKAINVIDRLLTIEENVESDEEMAAVEESGRGAVINKLLPKTRAQQTISVRIHSFEILPTFVEAVKKRCIELDYPMLEEYDFRNDHINSQLPFHHHH
jgi:DNA excision repair protein ERCC-3